MSAVLDSVTPISAAVALARAFGDGLGLSLHDRARLCIVAEELVANLVDHGAAGAEPPILRMRSDGAGIRLALIDYGPPFDPRSGSKSLRRRQRGGGAGLALVRAWTEVLDYSSAAGRNRLELIFPRDGARSARTRCAPDDLTGDGP